MIWLAVIIVSRRTRPYQSRRRNYPNVDGDDDVGKAQRWS
jgi:hypothetical protein